MKIRSHSSLVLFFVSCLLLATQTLVVGQTFSINPNRSEQNGKAGDYFAANVEIKNLTGQDVTVKLKKMSNTLPADWSGSMCTTSNCYGFDATNVEDVLKANTTGTFVFDITTTAETPGTGEVVFSVQSKSNPNESYNFTFKITTVTTAVHDPSPARSLSLSQNYPNPFSASRSDYTTISFTSPANVNVAVRIYTLLGREVRTLYSSSRVSGTTSMTWDGRDNAGNFVSPGMYIYKLETGYTTLSRRLLYTK
jgi:hypothetical protein